MALKLESGKWGLFVACKICHRPGCLDGERLVGRGEGSYHETQFVDDFSQEGCRRMRYGPKAEQVGCCGVEEMLLE